MNNVDKPAYPVATSDIIAENRLGLSKRERFAMAAMQGLATDDKYRGGWGSLAYDAVKLADATLKELEETDDNS